jgi:hypothetical protein
MQPELNILPRTMSEYSVSCQNHEILNWFDDCSYLFLENGMVKYWTSEKIYTINTAAQCDVTESHNYHETRKHLNGALKSKAFVYGQVWRYELATETFIGRDAERPRSGDKGSYFGNSKFIDTAYGVYRIAGEYGAYLESDNSYLGPLSYAGLVCWDENFIIHCTTQWITPNGWGQQNTVGYVRGNIKVYSTQTMQELYSNGVVNMAHTGELRIGSPIPRDEYNEHKKVITADHMMEVVKARVRILDSERIQIANNIITIKKKVPKIKKECAICFKKPKPGGLLAPCLHKEFCYACVKDITECPICRGVVSKVVEI